MEAPGSALAVSCRSAEIIVADSLTSFLVNFALTEAAYAVVRLLHRFPIIRLPPGQKVEIIGVEKQTMTLVLSSTEGCMVDYASGKEQEQFELRDRSEMTSAEEVGF